MPKNIGLMILYVYQMAGRWPISKPLKCLKYSSILAGLLFSSPAFGVCSPRGAILKKINNAALKHNVEPSLVRAIASVESCSGKYLQNNSTQDFGLMQINIHTLKALNIAPQEVMRDHDLSLELAIKILKDFKRSKNTTIPWECKYNIGNKKTDGALKACKAYLLKLRAAGYHQP